MSGDARTLAIVALIATAPVTIVVLVALIRGYTISLSMRRNGKDGKD